MSHFLTFVLIPKNSPDVHQAVATLLAPFDENIDVAPYSTECYCVGVSAQQEGVRIANHTIGSIDDLRTRYRALAETDRPPWDWLTADWRATAERAERAHPLYRQPDPDCQTCHGSGQRLTTYNPESRWDWWVIGGRWEGWLGPDNCQLTLDVAAQLRTPFALVTPNGAWHEEGQMGWFGRSRHCKEPAAWNAEVEGLLLGHPDALVVACDLHI